MLKPINNGLFIILKGQPIPKPRMTKKSWFNNSYWDYFNSSVESLKYEYKPRKLKGDVVCEIKFYRKGKKRADLDNLLKTQFEILQKAGIIENDNQIISASAEIIYKSLEPKTEIEIRNKYL